MSKNPKIVDKKDDSGPEDFFNSAQNNKRMEFLTELFTNANGKANVQKILQDIKANKSRRVNILSIKNYHVPDLKETIAYLRGTTLEEAPEVKQELDGLLQAGLVEVLVRRVENMLPDMCRACNSMYSSTAVAGLQCIRCDRVAHMECFNKDEATLRTTIMYGKDLVYICNLCNNGVIKEKVIKDHMKTKKRKQTEVGAAEKTVEPAPETSEIPNPFSDSDESTDEDDTNEDEEAATRWAKRQKKATNKKENAKNKAKTNEVQETEAESEKPMCIHFRNNRCKFGLKGEGCKFYHPKRCNKKWKGEAGGCKNANCKLFHGKLCKGSLQSKVCLKENCTYLHSKDTRRTPTNKSGQDEEANENKKKSFKCGQCQNFFNTAAEMSEHTVEHHQNMTSPGLKSYSQVLGNSAFLGHQGPVRNVHSGLEDQVMAMCMNIQEMMTMIKQQQEQLVRVQNQQSQMAKNVNMTLLRPTIQQNPSWMVQQ